MMQLRLRFKLWLLKRRLASICKEGDVALWLSGGKDSRLLLEALLALRARFAVLRFDHTWSRAQKKAIDELILKHNLCVHGYAPAWGAVVVDESGQEMTVVSHYTVGSKGQTAVLFRDLVPGPACSLDVPAETAPDTMPLIRFDVHLVGTKRGETHWVMRDGPFLATRRWEIGDVDFAAPLFSWSDAEVVAALRLFGVEWRQPSLAEDTGNIAACYECFKPRSGGACWCPKEGKTIPAIAWSPAENLAALRQQLGV